MCRNIAFLFLLTMFSIFETSAQFDWVENKTLGPGIIHDAVLEEDGGLTIVGSIMIDSNSHQPLRSGIACYSGAQESMLWLARLDSNWDIMWERCYGGSGREWPMQLIKRNDTTYVVFFQTDSEDGDMAQNDRGPEVGVMVFDELGTMRSLYFYGGSGKDLVSSASATSDGGYIVGVTSNSSDGDLPGHYGNWYYHDAWVLKLDSVFNIEWDLWWGGTWGEQNPIGLELEDGRYVVSVSSSSSDYHLHGNNPKRDDVWLLRLGPWGDLLNQYKIASGPYEDMGLDFDLLSDGTLLFSGVRSGYYCSSEGRYASMWLANTDIYGNVIWEACYGDGAGNGSLYDAAKNDYGFVLNGFLGEAGGDVSNAVYGYDAWLVQTDSMGNILWERNVGGRANDYVRGLIPVGDELICFGNSYSTDYDLQGIGDRDNYTTSWLFKLGLFPVGIEPNQPALYSDKLKLYPNPTDDRLNIVIPNKGRGVGEVSVYDVSGKLYWQQSQTGDQLLTISTTSFPPGFYVVTVSNPEPGMFYSAPFSVIRP